MSKCWLGALLLGIWIGRGGIAHAAVNVSPDPLTFVDTPVGTNHDKVATLSATGATDVMVTVVLRGSADCAQFQILSPTGSVHVDNNTSADITMKFAPT